MYPELDFKEGILPYYRIFNNRKLVFICFWL